MPNSEDIQRVLSYIRTERAAGYDIATLRNYLLSNGYAPELVDAAIDELYGKNDNGEKKGFSFNLDRLNILNLNQQQKKIAVFAIVGVLLIGMGIMAFWFISGDIRSADTSTKITNGVQLTPGTGYLNQTMSSGKGTSLRAEKNGSGSSASGGTGTEPSDTSPQTDSPRIEIKGPVSGGTIKRAQLETEIARFDSSDAALVVCKRNTVDTDDCYAMIADRFEKPELCSKIESMGQKENCILSLALSEHGAEYCGEIQDTSKQNLCRNLGRQAQRDVTNNLAFREATPEEEAAANKNNSVSFYVSDEDAVRFSVAQADS